MRTLSLLAALLLTISAQASVWQNENQWTQEWQDKYSEWVRTDFTEDIFVSGDWKGISTDCAEAVYAARVIFSYLNKLPFVIKNPSGHGHITNASTQFDNYKDPLRRVRAFINYVKDNTDTSSLASDTYPVAINRNNIKPGTIWIRASWARENFIARLFAPANFSPGHAETVVEVDDTGIVHLLGSTMPQAVRQLIPVTSLEFNPVDQKLGFRAWILPQNQNLPLSQQPGYSLEEYSMGAEPCDSNDNTDDFSAEDNAPAKVDQSCGNKPTPAGFMSAVTARLGQTKETKEQMVTRHAKDLCSLAHARIEAVNSALAAKRRLHGACMGKDDWDNYSTTSRDHRIMEVTHNLIDAAGGTGFFESEVSAVARISELDSCAPLAITANESLTLKDFIENHLKARVSDDPNQSAEARWGIADTSGSCDRP